MIIWKGFGILVPIITFLTCLLFDYSTMVIFNDSSYYSSHSWCLSIALCLSGFILHLLSQRFNFDSNEVVYMPNDKSVSFANHSFFFIRIRYWAILLQGFAIISLFISL